MKFRGFFRKNKKEILSSRKVGERVTMDGCILDEDVSIGDDCILYNLKLGSYSYISFRVSAMNTEIGKFCSVAQGVGINLGMHPSNTFVSSSPVFFSIVKQCGVTFSDKSYFREIGSNKIGNDVWIGANTIIMGDITIGDGAIIGAGSIVTRDIPPYSISVGVPAKVIKYRFTPEEIDFLLQFKWWDRESDWLKNNYKDFHDIKLFMSKYKIDV